MNPNSIPLLEKHPEKISWRGLCFNPNAIHLLEKYPDKIKWDCLSSNRSAIPLLEKYPDNPLAVIDWNYLSENPNLLRCYTHFKKIF